MHGKCQTLEHGQTKLKTGHWAFQLLRFRCLTFHSTHTLDVWYICDIFYYTV